MPYDDPYIAGATAQLSWHISTDGILYAREMQTGVTYKMIRMTTPGMDPPVPKVPDAPVDGQLYGRQNANWHPIRKLPLRKRRRMGRPMAGRIISGKLFRRSRLQGW